MSRYPLWPALDGRLAEVVARRYAFGDRPWRWLEVLLLALVGARQDYQDRLFGCWLALLGESDCMRRKDLEASDSRRM